MSQQIEAFEKWWDAEEGEKRPKYMLELQAAFTAGYQAGAAAQRERDLAIVLESNCGAGPCSWEAAQDEIARRIREGSDT